MITILNYRQKELEAECERYRKERDIITGKYRDQENKLKMAKMKNELQLKPTNSGRSFKTIFGFDFLGSRYQFEISSINKS